MVIGDIHGMLEPLKNAIEWASVRNLFCIFLGDILDYGPNSLECVERVYDVVTRGKGVMVLGNHEKKIKKYIEGQQVYLSDGNKVTISLLNDMSSFQRNKWINKFNSLYHMSRNHWCIGHTIFTHAAATTEMYRNSHRLRGYSEIMAVYGQTNSDKSSRIYDWIDEIGSYTVMVGHDIRSTVKPLRVLGKQGSEVYFLDTGCGKGGGLTVADMIFNGDRLIVQNFTQF
jgi:protein phosphatase